MLSTAGVAAISSAASSCTRCGSCTHSWDACPTAAWRARRSGKRARADPTSRRVAGDQAESGIPRRLTDADVPLVPRWSNGPRGSRGGGSGGAAASTIGLEADSDGSGSSSDAGDEGAGGGGRGQRGGGAGQYPGKGKGAPLVAAKRPREPSGRGAAGASLQRAPEVLTAKHTAFAPLLEQVIAGACAGGGTDEESADGEGGATPVPSLAAVSRGCRRDLRSLVAAVASERIDHFGNAGASAEDVAALRRAWPHAASDAVATIMEAWMAANASLEAVPDASAGAGGGGGPSVSGSPAAQDVLRRAVARETLTFLQAVEDGTVLIAGPGTTAPSVFAPPRDGASGSDSGGTGAGDDADTGTWQRLRLRHSLRFLPATGSQRDVTLLMEAVVAHLSRALGGPSVTDSEGRVAGAATIADAVYRACVFDVRASPRFACGVGGDSLDGGGGTATAEQKDFLRMCESALAALS